ncbi:hypothetical protein ABID14_001497 [Peptoniphilus olsenii]|uniref:Uncharacterized protein n=1 Tax=Peptoniphilus olsenii TaxID=411570 RepID=A0ABV2JAQ4_9FIRM
MDKELSHSWSINAQRHAYDFLKLDDKLKSYNSDRKKLENYYCYESDIISPSDGIIFEVSNK